MKPFSQITLLAVTLPLFVLGPSPDAHAEMTRWNVDHAHSTVGFQVAHMVISKTNGKFTEYRGFIDMDPDTQQVKAIEAVIQTQSVFTDHKKRDKHLRSPDFFDVEKFPTMTYTMKSYKKAGDTYTAVENLNVTKVEVLADLATSRGIDREQFLTSFQSAELRKEVLEEFDSCRKLNISGFPSLLTQDGQQVIPLAHGYQSIEALTPLIDAWLEKASVL